MEFMRDSGIQFIERCKIYEGLLEELKVDPAEKKLAEYKEVCLNHVSRIDDIDSRPVGRGGGGGGPGRPLKRLLDG
jgi:hypothetical protein